MWTIPQSTSYTHVFKAYLSSDHVTEATGKTIAITISKAGAAFGNLNAGATNATEIANGWYKVTLDTTDTGTAGVLAIRGAEATIDDVGDRLFVNAYNDIADAILNRDMSTGTDSGSSTIRTVRQALRFLRNKWDISGGTLTVRKEDDSTTSWTSTITGNPATTASDPAGP